MKSMMTDAQKKVVAHLEDYQKAEARAVFRNMDQMELQTRMAVLAHYTAFPPEAPSGWGPVFVDTDCTNCFYTIRAGNEEGMQYAYDVAFCSDNCRREWEHDH